MKTITAFSRDDFRKWLQEHHTTEIKVGIILHKRHTGKTAPTHREMIEEALCFGWIDTIVKRIDENTYQRNFSKRNEKSTWSDNTLSYAKHLLAEGKMVEQGIHFYNAGLKKKTHDHNIPKNPDMPEEIKKALSKNKLAKTNFEKFPPSKKKELYRWFLRAKGSETKIKRIEKII